MIGCLSASPSGGCNAFSHRCGPHPACHSFPGEDVTGSRGECKRRLALLGSEVQLRFQLQQKANAKVSVSCRAGYRFLDAITDEGWWGTGVGDSKKTSSTPFPRSLHFYSSHFGMPRGCKKRCHAFSQKLHNPEMFKPGLKPAMHTAKRESL